MNNHSFWKIRPWEKFLVGVTCAYILFFYLLRTRNYDFFSFLTWQAQAFEKSFYWFSGLFIFLVAYAYFKLLRFLTAFSLAKKTGDRTQIKEDGVKVLYSLAEGARFLFLIVFAFAAFMLVLGAITSLVQGRVDSLKILEWDKKIFGVYPFIWLHTPSNPFRPFLHSISWLILRSFTCLSLVMGASLIFFFFFGKRKIFFSILAAYFIGATISLPFWYVYPSHSPNNFYLANNNILSSDYEPDRITESFQIEVQRDQKKNPPISTFPSSHAIWALEVVYFWGIYKKKSLFFFIPWIFLMLLGTVYFAQHYLVDIILAVPIAFLAIIGGNKIGDLMQKEEV